MDGFNSLLIFLPGRGRPINSREICSDNRHGAWLHLNLTSTLGSDNKIIIMIIMTHNRTLLCQELF